MAGNRRALLQGLERDIASIQEAVTRLVHLGATDRDLYEAVGMTPREIRLLREGDDWLSPVVTRMIKRAFKEANK